LFGFRFSISYFLNIIIALFVAVSFCKVDVLLALNKGLNRGNKGFCEFTKASVLVREAFVTSWRRLGEWQKLRKPLVRSIPAYLLPLFAKHS